jgi:ACS family hexuronate transporter-like MFS transporter
VGGLDTRFSGIVLAPLFATQGHLESHGTRDDPWSLSYVRGGGIFLDAIMRVFGPAAAVVCRSPVNILTGFATSVSGFVAFRFMRGIGEGVNWPGVSKAATEWFPSAGQSLCDPRMAVERAIDT